MGIIGVVAALTLPSLISNYNRHVVETRLEKFYSIMNQAAKQAELEYGEFEFLDRGTNYGDTDGMINFWNTFFAPYVKTLKVEKHKDNPKIICIYLADGTKMDMFNYFDSATATDTTQSTATHIYFYPKSNNKTNIMGKDLFTFFMEASTNKNRNIVEPYKYKWDGTEDDLINGQYGCRKDNTDAKHYCTALIQYHGWKIPKDYPFRF